ncbi:MAG: hypothetical protein ACKOTB_00130 [Planctomycetia bacterium]
MTIIFAAQMRLRRLRRSEMGRATPVLRERIREVVAARESLLLLSLVRPSMRRRGQGEGPGGIAGDGRGG